jgi:peptide/nickel transport system substrate-binding protein
MRAGALALAAVLAFGTQPASAGTNPWTIAGVARVVSDELGNLNPLFAPDAGAVELAHLWGGFLFNVDDRGELSPELATVVPTIANGGISADGRRIEYHLRRGVQWQDGAPFTADDVIFTWQQVMNPANAVGSRSGYEAIERIDRVSDTDVVVHLRAPYAPFVSEFLVSAYCVLPKHLLGRESDLNDVPYNAMPVGTGPFIVSEFRRGEFVRLIANPHYWRGAPKLSSIQWKFVPDSATAALAIRTHDADLRTAMAPQQLDLLRGVPGLRFVGTQQNAKYIVAFNLSNAILADRDVRQALAYATDVDAFNHALVHDLYARSASAQPPFSWAHTDAVRTYPYDPARARSMLEAAGWHVGAGGVREKNGVPLSMRITTLTTSTIAASVELLLQSEWHAVGVALEIKNYDPQILYAPLSAGGVYASGNFDVAIAAEILGSDPDDSMYTLCSAMPPSGLNALHYCNPAVDAAEHEALTHNDRATRARAYALVQQHIAEDVPYIVLWYVKTYDAVNTDLQNYRPAPGGVPDWNAWQWSI